MQTAISHAHPRERATETTGKQYKRHHSGQVHVQSATEFCRAQACKKGKEKTRFLKVWTHFLELDMETIMRSQHSQNLFRSSLSTFMCQALKAVFHISQGNHVP